MTTVVINQPCYLPWLGLFERLAKADIFVFLDTVQFERHEWQNRNRLKGADDQPFYITVPVLKSKDLGIPIREVLIAQDVANGRWREKHLNAIKTNLGRTPYFNKVFPIIKEVIEEDTTNLAILNIKGIERIACMLGLNPRFVRASALNPDGNKTSLVVDICKKVSADCYYSSVGARAYMDAEMSLFRDANVQVVYQEWQHPAYQQRGKKFVSHLSIIDALMNLGPEGTKSLLKV